MAKTHVATHQESDDYTYVGSNVPEFDSKGKKTIISCERDYDYELSIEGNHNRYNAEFVHRIATEVYGCDSSAVKAALKTFTGLAHRLQKIATVDGADYYDDSISTIPQATISAATSLKTAKTLLIGGMDRGIDYTVLEEFMLSHNEYIYICMYESGKRIYDVVIDRLGEIAGNSGRFLFMLKYVPIHLVSQIILSGLLYLLLRKYVIKHKRDYRFR